MFDFRYHALSLAAVLFALALGVLIGVAIGDSSLVSSAKNGIVHNLKGEVAQAQRQSDQLQERLYGEEALASGLYTLAVHEALAGRTVGIVYLGASSDRVNSLVRSAVDRAGGTVALVVAVREPLQLEAIARESGDAHLAALASSAQLVARFADIVGRQLVSGGALVARELVSRVRPSLMSAFDGQLTRLEGLVVVRAEPGGMTPAQSEVSAAFASGLLTGVSAAGATPVGAELKRSAPSQVPWFKSKGISSVDDLDTLAGQAALALALSGERGSFGVKASADSLLPGVAPAPAH